MSADWSGVFPSYIPDGFYYIGWIIDADNEIEELNEDNNVIFSHSFYVQVETRDTYDPMDYIYIPIILAVVVILVVFAVGFVLTKRNYPDLEIFFPSSEAIPLYKPESESTPQ